MEPAGPSIFHPLTDPGDSLPGVAAVDGSFHVLQDHEHWSVATRTASVAYPGGLAEAPVQIHSVAAADAHEAIRRRYEPHHIEPPAPADAATFAALLSTIQEYDAARQALTDLPPGGLLLLDGSLHDLPHPAAALVKALGEAAKARHVHLVGVVRHSGLHQDGRPLVPALRLKGIEALPGEAWYTSLDPHTHVCLLEPRAARAYRVDTPDLEALPMLVPLSHDRTHRGYPYPLAVAMNAAAIEPDRLPPPDP